MKKAAVSTNAGLQNCPGLLGQSQDISGQAIPLVSVVIPAYNASRFIERTLESVLSQTYRNLEVLVVNDGSTDDTATIVERYVALDSRITLLHQANAGVAAARNLGIETSTGELIAFVDADDVWYPTNLEKQVQVLANSDESVGMVYSWSADIDEDDQLTGNSRISRYYGYIFPALFDYNIIGNASAIMVRRQCFERVGGYSTELRAQKAQGCEDWDIYLRIAAIYQVYLVPEILVGYRQLVDSMSRNVDAMMKSRFLTLQTLESRFPGLYPRIERWSAGMYQTYIARQYYKTCAYSEALQWLLEAVRTDPLMILVSYGNWILLVRILGKLLERNLLSLAIQTKMLSDEEKLRVLSKQKKNKTYSLIKIYLHFITNLLFPASIYRHWRIKQLTAQIYPAGPEPQILPFWQTSLAILQVRKLAVYPDGHLFFQNSKNNTSSEDLMPSPLTAATQVQEAANE